MIYGRTGEACAILRLATEVDVRKLENRKPDKQDKFAIQHGGLVVIRWLDDDDNNERLAHQAYLRADGGSREINDAIELASYRAWRARAQAWYDTPADDRGPASELLTELLETVPRA